jgi:dTDP-4-amino-4,6-dideoxygalactose transaminase
MMVTKKTKAIVPVHYAGHSCNMDVINKMAEKKNLFVIEDAAQALFSKYNGKNLGTIGHLGCLSFHETKNVISGEGGALLINDERFIERAQIIWQKGTDRKNFEAGLVDKYTWVDIGSSFLPGEIIAAFLYAQLERAEEIISKRKKLFSIYFERLKPLEEKGYITLPHPDIEYSANGHIFYFLTKNAADRTELLSFLNNNNIKAIFHYIPLHSASVASKFSRVASSMDITDDVSVTIVRLPLFFEMTIEEIEYVIYAIYSFYGIK